MSNRKKSTDVTYKWKDLDRKLTQHRNNFLPYYPKEDAFRELTRL